MVIEEGEGDFKERCVIIKGEKKNVEEEVEQADNEQSEQPTETETKPGTSLVMFCNGVGSFQFKMFSVRQGTQHFTDENKVSRK